MKRTFLVTIMLLFAGMIVFSQQTGSSSQQTSAQIKQNAQQSLAKAKTNSSQFESTLNALKTQITSNSDAITYKKLQANIDQLESKIVNAQSHIQSEIDQGHSISASMIDQVQRLIEQHKAAMAEMEGFAAK